ncbi:peptide chain release factor N(5)-glutamine methyltransferase [Sphingorhabdus contaminans]|uniref:peptide chain release factor N(5)-glutamine methyltransferase n=1 Tax=Sphingorhabdus contaminans TaxID=1343899 RepID=UPI003D2BCAC7
MGNLAETLRNTATRLAGISTTARLDAELLAAHALGLERSEMLLRMGDLDIPPAFDALTERRLRNEPVAYITGRQAFWDLDLVVTPDVLIPRADSETLIELAVDHFKLGTTLPARILDLGTGSGALLLACLSAFPSASGVGMEASTAALAVAEANGNRLGFASRANWVHRSWAEPGWHDDLGRFDLVISNPPYVETDAGLDAMVADYEPHSALFAGPDGLDDYRLLIPQLASLLAPGGIAIFEIGHSQAAAVSDLASNAGLSTEMRRDLAGKPRALRFSLGIGGMNG